MQASDVYSFAIIAWHLVCLGDEFFSMSVGELYVQIVDLESRSSFPDQTNKDLMELIVAFLNPIPSKRPSIIAALPLLVMMYNQSL